MNIKETVERYKLIPLFPDANIGENEEMVCKITETSISFSGARKVNGLGFICMVVFNKKDGSYNCTYSSLIFRGQGENLKTIYDNTVTSTKANLPDLMNFYNEFYEQWAKEVNKLISDDLKEELEKAKEEQKQKEEQEKSEQGEQEEKGEQGEDSESGEGEEGGEESGEQGEGDGGEMSSEETEKMIEEINKSQSGENQDGQSSSNSDNIDLEDFLEQVEEGNADNDFTKNYNNKELKEKIDYQKQENQDMGSSSAKQDLQSYEVKNVLRAVQDILGVNSDEVKRRFHYEKRRIRTNNCRHNS